ncbi:MAG: hypothetical protein ACLUGJ_01240 [Blautia wexlerae]
MDRKTGYNVGLYRRYSGRFLCRLYQTAGNRKPCRCDG